MKATVAYFSVTGRNEQVAEAIERELVDRGVTVERVFLKPRKSMGAVGSAIRSLFNRPVELDLRQSPEPADLLALVGPVYASSVCPPVATYLRSLTGLDGAKVINVVCGYNTHPEVIRTINGRLRALGSGPIVERTVRLKDIDSPDRVATLARDVVAEAIG